MIDTLLLTGHLLYSRPLEGWVQFIPWHLLGLLAGLTVFAAFGMHFVFGHVFRFYRRKGKHSYLLSLPSLLLCQASMLVLLAAYLLWANAPVIIASNMDSGPPGKMAEHIGALLLQPAFESPAFRVGRDSIFPDCPM